MTTVVYLHSADRQCPCGRRRACTRAEMLRKPDQFFFVMIQSCQDCGEEVEVDTRKLAMEPGASNGRCLVCDALDEGMHQSVTMPAFFDSERDLRGMMCPGCLQASLDAEVEAYERSR